MSEKKLPPEIKAILEKDEITIEEADKLDAFFGDGDEWRKRGKAELEVRREAEERYRKNHPPLPDPEWW